MTRDFFAPRVDWKLILADLRDRGCTGYRVAQALGVQWSTVHYWLHAEKPPELKYGLGRALLRLHAAYCGAAMTTRRHMEAEKAA